MLVSYYLLRKRCWRVGGGFFEGGLGRGCGFDSCFVGFGFWGEDLGDACGGRCAILLCNLDIE